MPCNGPLVHPLPSCKLFFKEDFMKSIQGWKSAALMHLSDGRACNANCISSIECWPKLEHNTVSKKQLLKRQCHKTLVYLEFQPQGGYFCSSNFPKSFCPIRLNRTPARNIYEKIRPSSWMPLLDKPWSCQKLNPTVKCQPHPSGLGIDLKQQLQSCTSTGHGVIFWHVKQIQFPSPICQLRDHHPNISPILSNIFQRSPIFLAK